MSDLNFRKINRTAWEATSGDLFYRIYHKETLRTSRFYLVIKRLRTSFPLWPNESRSSHKSMDLAIERANKHHREQVQG